MPDCFDLLKFSLTICKREMGQTLEKSSTLCPKGQTRPIRFFSHFQNKIWSQDARLNSRDKQEHRSACPADVDIAAAGKTHTQAATCAASPATGFSTTGTSPQAATDAVSMVAHQLKQHQFQQHCSHEGHPRKHQAGFSKAAQMNLRF